MEGGPPGNLVGEQQLVLDARKDGQVMGRHASREELVTSLIRVGEQELTGEDEAEVDAYFAPDFAFRGRTAPSSTPKASRPTSRHCEQRSMT